jgi:large subunit ribosomal protein L6
MSRLGRKAIAIPDGVKVSVQGQVVKVEGPKGRANLRLDPAVSVAVNAAAKQVTVSRSGDLREQRAMHGTTRSLIAGMIVGVTTPYEKKLEIVGVGYNAKMQGKDLVLQLGYSHPVQVPVPEGLTVTCPSPTQIAVNGTDKRQVGQFAADIRAIRPPEPYNLKGIKYLGEAIRRKAGKTFVSGA